MVLSTSHWGAFNVTTDGSRILSVAPFEEDREPTDIINVIPKAVHHHTRIARPAIRKNWLSGRTGARDPGKENFVELPWDEALDIAAAEIDRVVQSHGSNAIFGGSYGWASAGRFHHAQSQLKRFLNCTGGFVSGYGSYSAGASYVIIPHMFGVDHHEFSWCWQNSWKDIVEHTETLVAFGGINPKNSQVNAGGIGCHKTRTHLSALISKGADVLTVSPQATDGPADGEWLPIRPGTDVAMMLGLAYVIETEELADRNFLDRCTEGYFQFCAYLMGDTDGQPKSPEWASQICDVSADQIRNLARKMATTRTFITVAWALQRAEWGEQTYWMATTLASMIGQIGLAGGGVGFGYGAVGGIGSGIQLLSGCTFPQGENKVQDVIPVARIADMLLNPGGDYHFNGRKEKYPDIRMVYWAGGNPFHHHQDLKRLQKAWNRPETIIVNEPWWTATAQRADIIFPVTTTYEREDIGRDKSDPFIFHMPKLIEPVGDARNDHQIFCGLAKRLQIEDAFTEARSESEWLQHLYGQFEDRCAAAGVDVPTFQELKERNWVHLQNLRDAPESPLVKFRKFPDQYPLNTPSGRIEIFSKTIKQFGYEDCIGHPVWCEPTEWLGSELATEFPLHLVSPQPSDKLHSQFESALADHHGTRPTPISIHTNAAAKRGIKNEDIVEVFNNRGKCLATANITDKIREDVVSLPTGAWLSLDEHDRDLQGNPNVLTRDIGTSRLSQGATSHTTQVDLRRVEK